METLPLPEISRVDAVAVAAGLVGAWLLWRLCRRIVRIGWFVVYFVAGLALAWLGALWAKAPAPPVALMMAGALVFAWVCSTIRSRVARLVSALAVLAICRVLAGGDLLKPFLAPVQNAVHEQGMHRDSPMQ